jgi:hypothetical protein
MEADTFQDECHRCGYDLRGIANDRPCPECGLLAQRSRRETDELHNSHPRWLGSMSWGFDLVLAGFAITVAWPFVCAAIVSIFNLIQSPRLWLAGFDVGVLTFLLGIILLTQSEGHLPGDRADRRLRLWLRLAALPPIVALALASIKNELPFHHIYPFSVGRNELMSRSEFIVDFLLTLGLVPLPLLLFLRLRGLARRVPTKSLDRNCAGVGIGASAALLWMTGLLVLFNRAESWGLGPKWSTRSNAALFLVVLLIVAGLLLSVRGVSLLVRFAITFHSGARQLRHHWSRDDRSIAPTAAAPNVVD